MTNANASGETKQLREALASIGKRLGGVALGLVFGADSDKTKPVELTGEQIRDRAKAVAAEIGQNHAGEEITLVSVQTGASVWLNYLREGLAEYNESVAEDERVSVLFDDIKIKSYNNGTNSDGVMRFVNKPYRDVSDQKVIVVEDIVDSGRTIGFLQKYFASKAKSVEICTMLDKPAAREAGTFVPDYCGFSLIGTPFVVGLGLDVDERGRELPSVYTIDDL
jgi:hypoxanthine phosphoribosyltransferase